MARERPAGWVIGRVAGIDLRLHPTFLLLVAVALLGFLGPPAAAIARLALVFGSVVLHELAHALVARHRGVGVRDIVLLPIGGISELERIPDDPRAQAAIAAAGPASSLLIASTAALGCLLAGGTLWPVDLADGSVLHVVAWLNALLGGFNLLPALPLDGGRLLRAHLATRLSPDEATLRAAEIGRRLAWGLVLLGAVFDLALLIVGLFVLVVGRAEASVALAHQQLRDVRVAELRHPMLGPERPLPELRVHDDDRASDVLEDLLAQGEATVLDEHEHVVGVVGVDDIAAALRHRRTT